MSKIVPEIANNNPVCPLCAVKLSLKQDLFFCDSCDFFIGQQQSFHKSFKPRLAQNVERLTFASQNREPRERKAKKFLWLWMLLLIIFLVAIVFVL